MTVLFRSPLLHNDARRLDDVQLNLSTSPSPSINSGVPMDDPMTVSFRSPLSDNDTRRLDDVQLNLCTNASPFINSEVPMDEQSQVSNMFSHLEHCS